MNGVLPENTTAVLSGPRPTWNYKGEESVDEDGLLCRMRLVDGGWIVDKDFVENDRPWGEGDEEAFLAKFPSREDVYRYFVHHEDDGPQREYSALSDYEYGVTKFVTHSGTYYTEDNAPDGVQLDEGEMYNIFNVRVPADCSDFGPILDEIGEVIVLQNEVHPNVTRHVFSILEDTLSRYGSYELHVLEGGAAEIVATRGEDLEFERVRDALKYMKRHLSYGRLEDDDDD
jgi:hypothetical protein